MDSDFDVEHDFSGLEFSPDKVKVTFHEAKDKSGEAFNIGKAGTYKAVYLVEPVSRNPSYHISRNIVVGQKMDAGSVNGAAVLQRQAGNGGEPGLTADGAILQAEEPPLEE